MIKTRLLILALAVVLTGGCTLGPDYMRPETDLPLTEEGGSDENYELFTQVRWWDAFNDPELNKLIEEALLNNRNLVTALARVEEASGRAGVAFADRLPQLGAAGSGSRQQVTRDQAMSGAGAGRIQTSWQANAIFSFELDLWGKYRRLDEAAQAEFLASEASRDTVQLTLSADVANAYFLLRSLQAQCLIASNMLDTYDETCAIFTRRLEAGLIQEIDLRRMEAERDANAATLHLLKNSLSQAETMLAVLVGKSPRNIIEYKFSDSLALEDLQPPPLIPENLPSGLLARRPDIRQAEGLLIAANARIGAARAAFFPSISLTGGGGYLSGDVDSLFNGSSAVWNFVGNLGQPIFQGGRLIAQEAVAQAQYKQMFANYELTVQQAFKDARDALINNQERRIVFNYRLKQVQSLERSLYLANRQYEVGTIGLMDLLDVRRNLLRGQLDLADGRQAQLSAVVLLCKSLGGGWREDLGFREDPGDDQ
ncbi:MAG: efflux transporter outer membrane subunit [Desulfarculales bacterium]|nr:efflux transporter outer membrane subunit [Desulfarculales bacterium]